jgi:hypothetical protein
LSDTFEIVISAKDSKRSETNIQIYWILYQYQIDCEQISSWTSSLNYQSSRMISSRFWWW